MRSATTACPPPFFAPAAAAVSDDQGCGESVAGLATTDRAHGSVQALTVQREKQGGEVANCAGSVVALVEVDVSSAHFVVEGAVACGEAADKRHGHEAVEACRTVATQYGCCLSGDDSQFAYPDCLRTPSWRS